MTERLVAERLRVERSGKVILRDVDVTAKTGEVLGVLGPSGAGKSTLFRALVGEIHADAGTVSLDGTDVTRWPLWRRARAGFGYIPQSPSVLWDMTVRENLTAFQRVVHGEVKDDVEKAARSVDLQGRLDVKAGVLSAGERRRLEFARALTRTPKILVCDEPFSGVDPVGAEKLGELLRELAMQDVLVLLADHHVAEALRICTRALLLLDGAIAVMADPATFEEHPLVKGRYLGTWRRTMPPPDSPDSA
jgi:lipopolysaccharide export system ATP-binding protein